MYKGEAFIGICATAAVMDPLELGCCSSLPTAEIQGLEDQQSLFWPKKGIDSSEAGTLLVQRFSSSSDWEYIRVATWPSELCVAQDIQAVLRTSPSLCWCPPELGSELTGGCYEDWSLGNNNN